MPRRRPAPPTRFTWRTVIVDGQELHYRVGGPEGAPVMVHVHGFAISGSYLMPTAELLAEDFRVYVPDLPGFGRSPKPAKVLTIEELGSTLHHFMLAVGIERAVVVGNSLGCAITAELIADAPEIVEKAVMVGLAGGKQNQPLVRAVGQMAKDGLKEPPALLTVAAPDYLRFGVVRAIKLFTWMTEFPAIQRFLAMPVPVMVVIGSEDPLRPSWKRIRAVLNQVPPGVTLVLFQGAAHAINFTHPRELSHAIRQYVAGEQVRMDPAHPDGIPVLQLLRPE